MKRSINNDPKDENVDVKEIDDLSDKFIYNVIDELTRYKIYSIFDYANLVSYLEVIEIMESSEHNNPIEHISYYDVNPKEVYEIIVEPIKVWNENRISHTQKMLLQNQRNNVVNQRML